MARCLVYAELTGQPSHGLARLPFLLERLRGGWINPRPVMRLVHERPAAIVLDADNSLGPVAGVAAMDLAVARARSAGVGLCAVRHSNHFGAAGYYVDAPAGAGLIGLAFTNTPPAMAPPGGRHAMLGTNPIAVGFPTSGQPFVVDLATSQVARGRILKAAKANESIPLGWATDASGQETPDAHAALDGTLLPLGGPKGFALALVVEVLAGVLSGSAVGPEVQGTFAHVERESNVGHCFLAIDAVALDGEFSQRMDALVARLHASQPVRTESPVRLPGDRARRERSERQVQGIELPTELVEELHHLTSARLTRPNQ